MDYIGISVSFISVMLGLAYPILLQITIDDKLSSEKILDLFEENYIHITFKTSLKISLILALIYLIGIPRIIDFKLDFTNNLVANSALVMLIISTVVLVWSFFKLTEIIKIYYRPSKLITYFMDKDKENIKNNNYIYFDALTDIIIWSIQNQNILIGKELSKYFYTRYRTIRDSYEIKNNSGVIYPDRFYWMVYNIIQSMLKVKGNGLIFLETRTIGGIWLFGEFDSPKISETTYNWTWRNLCLVIQNNRIDLCFLHWKTAHQFINTNLRLINSDYDYEGDKIIVKNIEEVTRRENERNRFIEFHYALGGLVLYKNNYDLLVKFFNYTTSTPEQYPLLPSHMTEVFNAYFKFLDPFDNHFPWITEQYYFPGLESMNDLNIIKSWIYKYIGILYIRQFNLTTHYSYEKPLESPFFPKEIGEKRLWLNNFKYLVNTVKELLKEKYLLDTLNLEIQDDERYLSYLVRIENELKEKFNIEEINAELAKDKVELFYKNSNDILNSVFDNYDKLNNVNKIIDDEKLVTYNIQGTYAITDKGTFTNNGIDHLNFDSFQGQLIADEFRRGIAEIFNMNISNKYILNQEDVFPAIEKLNLNKDNFIIVCFGVHLEYFINFLKVANLTKTEFENVPIMLFPSNSRIVNNSFFILKKSDLPWFIYKDIDKKFIDLYKLKPINKKFKIYASVSDLSKNELLRNEIEKEEKNRELDLMKCVRQGISFRTFLKWKKNMKMVQIQVKDNYDTNNRLDKLDDITSFD